jgi:hypothetical protein
MTLLNSTQSTKWDNDIMYIWACIFEEVSNAVEGPAENVVSTTLLAGPINSIARFLKNTCSVQYITEALALLQNNIHNTTNFYAPYGALMV